LNSKNIRASVNRHLRLHLLIFITSQILLSRSVKLLKEPRGAEIQRSFLTRGGWWRWWRWQRRL